MWVWLKVWLLSQPAVFVRDRPVYLWIKLLETNKLFKLIMVKLLRLEWGLGIINRHMKGSNQVYSQFTLYVVSVQFILRYLCYRTAELMKKLPKYIQNLFVACGYNRMEIIAKMNMPGDIDADDNCLKDQCTG